MHAKAFEQQKFLNFGAQHYQAGIFLNFPLKDFDKRWLPHNLEMKLEISPTGKL